MTMKNINLSNRKDIFLLLIILIVILGLIAFFYVQSVDPSRILSRDSLSYDNSAKALLHTGCFAISPHKPHTPQTVRTPRYPVFIAVIYLIFGEKHFPVIYDIFAMANGGHRKKETLCPGLHFWAYSLLFSWP